jgi:transcriptional regulator with XRE-family HTH domain
MSETELKNLTFGEYLKRLRESRKLSQREAAKKAGISYAYLSQIEGSKRGKRKKGEDHFGPHPQMLKKLADAYEVSAGHLFERAGYLDNDQKNIYGFSERSEIDRIFDFVIHDPALNQIFTILDKRAIISRFESLAGKKLITWAGEPDKNPSASKPEFSGLRCQNETLYADTTNANLTLQEVAQELECEVADVEKMIQYGQLQDIENEFKQKFVEKKELQKFKHGAIRHWIYTTATRIPVAKPPRTLAEQNQLFQQLAEWENSDDEHIEVISSPAKELPKKKKNKSRK